MIKNLNSIFWAYGFGWLVFFGFYLTIAKRSSDLRAEIERLKRSASATSSDPSSKKG